MGWQVHVAPEGSAAAAASGGGAADSGGGSGAAGSGGSGDVGRGAAVAGAAPPSCVAVEPYGFVFDRDDRDPAQVRAPERSETTGRTGERESGGLVRVKKGGVRDVSGCGVGRVRLRVPDCGRPALLLLPFLVLLPPLDQDVALAREAHASYAPVCSFYCGAPDRFADLPLPTSEVPRRTRRHIRARTVPRRTRAGTGRHLQQWSLPVSLFFFAPIIFDFFGFLR